MSLSFKKLKRFKPGEQLTAEALNALTDAVERNTIEESPTVRPSRSASGSLQLHAKEWPETLFNPFYVSVLYNKKTKEEDGGYMLTLNRGAIYAPSVFLHQPSSQNADVPYTQFYRFEVGHLAQDPDDRDQKVAKPQSEGRDNLGDLAIEEPSNYNQFDSPIAQVNETWYCRLVVKFWEKPEEGITDLNQRKAFVDGGYADCQKFVEYVGCEWLREDDYLLDANDTEFEKYLIVAYVEVLENGNYKTHNVVRSDLALFDPCPVDVSSSSSSSSSESSEKSDSESSEEPPPPSDSESGDDSSACPPVLCVTDTTDPDWSAEVYQQSDILYSGTSDPDEVTVEVKFIDVGAVEEAATGRVDRWALFVDGAEVGEISADAGDCVEPGAYGDYEVALGPCPDSSSSSDSDECPETYCVVGPEWEVTVVRGPDTEDPFNPGSPTIRNWNGSRANDPGGDPFDVTEVSLTVNLDTSISELKVDSVSQGTETSPDDCPVEGDYGVYEVIVGSCGSSSVYSSDNSGSADSSDSSDSSYVPPGSSDSSYVYSSDSSGSADYDSSDSSSYDSSDPSKPAIVPFRKEWIRWACMEMPQAMFMDTREVPVKWGKGELVIEPEVLESVEPGSLFVLSTTPKEDVLALTNGVVVYDRLKVRYASGLLRKKPKTITVFYAGLRKGAGERFKRYQEDEAKRNHRFQNQWRKAQNDKT